VLVIPYDRRRIAIDAATRASAPMYPSLTGPYPLSVPAVRPWSMARPQAAYAATCSVRQVRANDTE
jgi:hypothetical protein